MADRLFHVLYEDGTYGEAITHNADDAEDQLSRAGDRNPVQLAHGAVQGSAPKGATVSLSNFGSER